MRIGLLGTTGYILSTIVIVMLLSQLSSFPVPQGVSFVFIIVAIAYIAGIVFRGIFWLRLGSQTNHRYFKSLSILIILLGIIASSLVLYLIYLHYPDLLGPIFNEGIFLKTAISLWAIYTIAEAGGYFSYARFFGIRSAYIGAISLLAVALLIYQTLTSESIAFLTQPQSLIPSVSLFILLGSAAAISYSSFIIKIDVAVKKAEKEELDELERILGGEPPIRREATSGGSVMDRAKRPTSPTLIHAYSSSSAPSQLAPSAMIVVEVISRSNEAFCPNCGSTVPIGSNACPSCGHRLYEPRPGLKCPVCGAPLSYSKRITSDHRVCGICFSDLRLRQSRVQ
jgi:hypothetical protein